MARITGIITIGDKIILPGVSINLLPNNDPSGVMGFHGDFTVPVGSPHISAGTSCQLKCSDGRSGEILVKHVHVGSHQPTRVEFVTNGPFV